MSLLEFLDPRPFDSRGEVEAGREFGRLYAAIHLVPARLSGVIFRSLRFDGGSPGEMTNALGKHLIAELWVRDPQPLNESDWVRDTLVAASKSGGFTVLDVSTHTFSPHGVTAVVLLSESHMSIHTWPEYGYAAVDIFTCGGSPREALAEIERRLDVERMEVRELDRGIVGAAPAESAHSARDRAVDLSRAV